MQSDPDPPIGNQCVGRGGRGRRRLRRLSGLQHGSLSRADLPTGMPAVGQVSQPRARAIDPRTGWGIESLVQRCRRRATLRRPAIVANARCPHVGREAWQTGHCSAADVAPCNPGTVDRSTRSPTRDIAGVDDVAVARRPAPDPARRCLTLARRTKMVASWRRYHSTAWLGHGTMARLVLRTDGGREMARLPHAASPHRPERLWAIRESRGHRRLSRFVREYAGGIG